MIDNKKVLFCLQAGSNIGGGHLTRCLTLADALKSHGADISFWCNDEAWEFENLKNSKYRKFMPEPPLQKEFNLAIIDDYSMDAKDDCRLRALAAKIMVIDDLANRTHDCDFIVDFSPSRVKEHYQGLVPPTCQILTGVEYIILRPEFFELDNKNRYNKKMHKVFLTMGSIDSAYALPRVLNALEQAEDIFEVHTMVTSKTKSLNDVKAHQKLSKHTLIIHENLKNPANLMYSCDLAITAGGMTSLELINLGVPTLILVVADNQIENATTLDQRKLAKIIRNPAEILQNIQDIKNDKLIFEKINKGSGLKIMDELKRLLV